MKRLWPRLEQPIAAALLDELSRRTPEEVFRSAAVSHPATTYASTGGIRVSEADLGHVRDVILETAAAHGFPDRSGDPIAFDRAMAVRLIDLMPMADGEALLRPVWSFTSLVLAPDVTYWRFVRRHDRWNAERWVCTDRTRHMFARLWWQARQLTVETPEGRDSGLLDGLSESELNHLTERTSIGGYGPLVRAMARAVLALPSEQRQRDVVRESALVLLRRIGVVDPYSLSEDQLASLTASAVSQVVGAFDSISSPEWAGLTRQHTRGRRPTR